MRSDVTIIGGGLAGLSLSIDLKRRGHGVVVVEKGIYPRHKVCGEYISMESFDYLKSLCPQLELLNLPMIRNFKLSSTGKKDFTTKLDLGGFGISRYLLEEMLFKEAKEKGVEFFLNTKASDINFNSSTKRYSIHTSSGIVEASAICNSSGRKSNVVSNKSEKAFSSTNYIGVKYHVKLKRDNDLIEIHNFPGGYCGISNIEDGKSCLCYIVNAEQLKRNGTSISRMEDRVLYKNRNLKEIFTKAEFLFDKPETISGIQFKSKAPADENSFYLGDSAGSIAPITGNGMSMALRSASGLAEILDENLSGKITREKAIESYQKFWRKEFELRIKLSRHFQALSEYPLLTNMTIGVFNTFPVVARSIIKQTHGAPS